MLEGENQDERIPYADGIKGSSEGDQNLTNAETAHIPTQVVNAAAATNEDAPSTGSRTKEALALIK